MSDTRYLDVDALCNGNGRDEVFTLLSNSRRRSVLYVLYQSDEEVDFSDLVTEVAACETGRPPDELADEVTQSMYISLYQTHLPKLTDYGLVEYDDEERTITLTSRARDAVVSPDWFRPPEWHRYYALLLVGGLLASVFAWVLNGAGAWRFVSVFVLTGLFGVVFAHTQSVRGFADDGSYLSLDDLA
jgi:hypothetical protein